MTFGSARAALAPLAALLALSLLATPTAAQIYKYKDASGRVVVTDKPPPSKTPRRPAPLEEPAADAEPATAPAASESRPAVDPKLEAKRKELELRQKAEADEKQRAQEKEMKEFCDEARRQLAALESGQRVARYNATTGEREFLEDDQRNAEISRIRQRTAECK